jgi:hypothetical protein
LTGSAKPVAAIKHPNDTAHETGYEHRDAEQNGHKSKELAHRSVIRGNQQAFVAFALLG